MDILRKANLLYDSSLMAMDSPYLLMANGQDTGLIELPVSWILDDAPYFGRTGALPSPEADLQGLPGRVRQGLSGGQDADG